MSVEVQLEATPARFERVEHVLETARELGARAALGTLRIVFFSGFFPEKPFASHGDHFHGSDNVGLPKDVRG